MFENLGVPWASSLLGFIALVLIPVPVLFYFYGENIRAKSRYAHNDDAPKKKDLENGVEKSE